MKIIPKKNNQLNTIESDKTNNSPQKNSPQFKSVDVAFEDLARFILTVKRRS